MKITELELRLSTILVAHGDIEVVIGNADTGCLFRITSNDLTVCSDEGGKRLEIGSVKPPARNAVQEPL